MHLRYKGLQANYGGPNVGILTAGLNKPPLTRAKMETLTAREKPKAKEM